MTQLRQRLGKPTRNRNHLEYVASLPCMVCGLPSQAHHLLRPWSGVRGLSRRSGDENCVPLCSTDHGSLHAAGNEDRWFMVRFGDADYGRKRAEALWNLSPARAAEQGGQCFVKST